MYGDTEEINPGTKDVSMVDVSAVNKASANEELNQNQPQRRKSTLILNDDIDLDRMNIDEKNNHNDNEDRMNIDRSSTQLALQSTEVQLKQNEPVAQSQTQASSSNQQDLQSPAQNSSIPPPIDPNVTIPIEIKWVQGGEKVYVTGSFTGWRKMIGLSKQPDNNFSITLGLPVGTHRFRFVIDNELRFSDFLPTATDQMGNFVNYVEVTPENIQSHFAQESSLVEEKDQTQAQQLSYPSRRSSISRTATRTDSMWGLTNDDDDMGNGYSRYHDEVDADENGIRSFLYINDIPPIFTDPKVMEQYYVAIDKQSKSSNGQQQAWLHPPQLPPHLENVILNNFNSNDKDNNSGALPIPNHVVLNHLATTSIKHNTLAVASVVRYKRKYVTQILYAPLQQ